MTDQDRPASIIGTHTPGYVNPDSSTVQPGQAAPSMLALVRHVRAILKACPGTCTVGTTAPGAPSLSIGCGSESTLSWTINALNAAGIRYTLGAWRRIRIEAQPIDTSELSPDAPSSPCPSAADGARTDSVGQRDRLSSGVGTITTAYAAIRFGSTPENSRYVLRDKKIIGTISRAHDGTWIARTTAQLLDWPQGELVSGVSEAYAMDAVVSAALPAEPLPAPTAREKRSTARAALIGSTPTQAPLPGDRITGRIFGQNLTLQRCEWEAIADADIDVIERANVISRCPADSFKTVEEIDALPDSAVIARADALGILYLDVEAARDALIVRANRSASKD